jgi:glutamate formiminotransferase
MSTIECIPNVSEGARAEVVSLLVDAVRGVPGVQLLDSSSDPDHNRSVITFAGGASSLKHAVLALFECALATIDLRSHVGEHPRIGAVDVVPFVPLGDTAMADCVALARDTGSAVADRFGVPVYLYEEAALLPARRNLEDIRRGGFEGLATKMQTPGWRPDFGPSRPHSSAGAAVFGARQALIAYNINLATDQLEVARSVAAAVRASSGGLRFVKALGLKLHRRGIVQVSMNLVNYRETPIATVFEAVKREAAQRGVNVLESEIVGLVPGAALSAVAAHYLQLVGFDESQILEARLHQAR